MTEVSALCGRNSGGADTANGSVDPQLWHACAGSQVQVPQVGSSVIYFPQGHAEHASSSPEFPRGLSSSTVPCRVLSVKYLADTDTDEVYARIALQPESLDASANSVLDPPSPQQSLIPSKVASFAKTLTQSDANNGGGFSVPRYCAETIFPRLDYNEDPPVQIVLAKDVHGNVWKFRHIYRGTPRRHLLTTGWSNFVNQKKLVAGDAIVFLRGANGELCVGVRRSTKGMGSCDTATPWHQPSSITGPGMTFSNWDANSAEKSYKFLESFQGSASLSKSKTDAAISGSSFARNRARVSPKSVLDAATLAASGRAFEVIFYPRATIAEFCVKASLVRASLQQRWAPGMRFKMAVETEDASRLSWFMGTVSKVQEADPVLWPKSPWKMLLVTWDEPDLLQCITRVSPWQVELVSPLQIPPFSFPKKKMRLSHPADLLLAGQECMGLASGAMGGEMPGFMNPWHGYFNNIPAGMQGARQDQNYRLSFQMPKFSTSGFTFNDIHRHQDFPMIGEIVSTATNESSVHNLFQHGCGDSDNTKLLMPSSRNNAGNNSHSQLSSTIASGSGVESGRKKTTLLLFGKMIDTSQSFIQQSQVSSDSSRHEAISDGLKSEVCDDGHRFLPDQGAVSHPFKVASLFPDHQGLTASGSNDVESWGWLKQQTSCPARNALDTGSYNCKVFSESDDVGRTVDLSNFASYEQLYDALEKMFGAQKSDFLNRVICVDSMGFSRPIGDEPYWDFMKRVKRLKILTESSSENMTK
uniref:Auxin response factor n=1 Tax=Ceratopteris pteridoides TaxID=58167 RepID=A0A1X9T659_9MONI|nr:auxin response factor 10 [Ceratopteris pteridoides]